MRWRSKWDDIWYGDTRVVSKFLFFPKRIDREWRWLEKASYRQICVKVMNHGSYDYRYHKEWADKEWIS
jgi:hypothetical protein